MMQVVLLKIIKNQFQLVQKYRLQNPKNISHLNVNALRNKFEAVEELAQNKINICFFFEIKTDETFPNQQFMINGYKLFRRDRNRHDGEILCCINQNILSKTVNVEGIEKYCRLVLIEFSVKTRKWLCIGLYKSTSQNDIDNFIDNLSLVTN